MTHASTSCAIEFEVGSHLHLVVGPQEACKLKSKEDLGGTSFGNEIDSKVVGHHHDMCGLVRNSSSKRIN